MSPDEVTPIPKATDDRSYRKIDRFAYTCLGAYSLINFLWIAWALSSAGFGIFDTAIAIGLIVPIIGLLSLIGFQCFSRQNRFSILANIISVLVIAGWFLAVWYIIVAASAAV